jgi:CheY-like chemotaxis protein
VRLLTTRLLKKAGYRVLNAADGEQALLASEQHPGNIHLLLTDLVMPRMGGRLLAERLASLRPALKILYMSGYTDDAIVRHGVMDVRTQLLAKPFSEVELTRKVRAVLDGMLVTSGTNWPAIPEASEERPMVAPRALPQSDAAQPGRTAIDARHARSGAMDVQGSKILVVDDSTDNLRLLTAVLKRGGLVPRPVTSAKLAIKAALADPPDLVLLDMRMPEMSGVEVCHCFKQDERLCDIPIIFISGLQSSDDKVEAFHAGGADFVSKPFVEEEVLARIETHLRLRRMEVDLAARRCPPAALN